ncbi:MAG: DNA polymerase III, subunit gamma and tau [candidate division SR1 bacterium CG_4_9_14_3_um_filter_40_9]|nr:MAG: DNA polymerase III, subunit gamma and tau [candidate division SR1 bacterium CG_4_9_14_3_um_filter_40_9]
MSLANKHRPQTFDHIIGQGHITEILKAQIAGAKDSHSNYLFFGPRGTGKTTTARVLAKAMNCLNLSSGNPCNECVSCLTINKQSTLDYIEIDAASHTGVENIREEILDKVPYPPTHLKKKIYVIDEVHMLSKGAFNALLKTIEEPRDNVGFILATTEIHKVPETIISRCQVFNFKKVGKEDMTKHLQHIVKLEGLNYTPGALDTVVRISEGCVRDAIKYIDQVSILGDINEEHITKFLGIASESIIKNFLNLIKNKDRDAIFSEIDAINEQGVDMHNFAKQTLMYIDQYLSEDTDFLLAVSEIFTEILGTIKYYPYPAIVYKIAINKFLNPSAPVEIAIPRPVQTQAAEAKAETTNTKPVAQAGDSNLLAQLLARVDKPSLQKNLGEHIIIDSVEDDKVHIIVINKLTHTLLEKRENLEYLEKILSEVLNKPITLKVSFEKKEDYFGRKLTTNN